MCIRDRLLAQMMFTGSTDQIDSVFQLYVNRKKTRESVVKAYFTEKSVAYFLERKKVDGRVFEYLESAVNQSIEKDKVPTKMCIRDRPAPVPHAENGVSAGGHPPLLLGR